MALQDGFSRWLSKMALQDGYPRWLFQMALQCGSSRWLSKTALQDGSPRRLLPPPSSFLLPPSSFLLPPPSPPRPRRPPPPSPPPVKMSLAPQTFKILSHAQPDCKRNFVRRLHLPAWQFPARQEHASPSSAPARHRRAGDRMACRG